MTQEKKTKKVSGPLDDIAQRAMSVIGSVPSLIVHTIFFMVSFALAFVGVPIDEILLVVTTLVSLEAIYLSIFIQMSVNRNSQSLYAVEEDIDEIQEDIDDIQKDVDKIEEDIDEIQEDETEDEKNDRESKEALDNIEKSLMTLVAQIEKIKEKVGTK
jgi:septal ring factor EnvC (AmiA/AmiB activator)